MQRADLFIDLFGLETMAEDVIRAAEKGIKIYNPDRK